MTYVFLPPNNDATNSTRKTMKKTLAIRAAVPAITLKPRMPAMIAMMRKEIA